MIEHIIVLDQLEAALKAILVFYNDHGLSWGWAIVALTVTVRIVILPLTITQLRSMAAMQRIQPKVKTLQNQYKGKTDRESKAEHAAEADGPLQGGGRQPVRLLPPAARAVPDLHRALPGAPLRDPPDQ